MNTVLYFAPAACSRVTMAALEQVGIDYEERMVHFAQDEQKGVAYLALNPRGKVPTLVIDDEVIIENAVILYHLARRFPEAGLLPLQGSEVEQLRALSDLIWVSGAVHPMLHRLFRPQLYTASGDEVGVRESAVAALNGAAEKMVKQLAGRDWWFGERWSVVDAYLEWIFSAAISAGFPLADYPDLLALHERAAQWPAWQRMLAREAEAVERDKLSPSRV